MGLDETAEERAKLGYQAYVFALICHATFDVGATHLSSVLSNGQEVELLLEASLHASAYMPHYSNSTESSDALAGLLLRRCCQFSYEIEPWLKNIILLSGTDPETWRCLDEAVRKIWPLYARGTGWSVAESPYEHVLVARSASVGDDDDTVLPLQYDLLTGEFMVAGSLISTLPLDFRQHSTYQLLFGSALFTVIPLGAREQGMHYLATTLHHGHKLYFALLEKNELVVRSEKNKVKYELLSPESFAGEIPTVLRTSYTHWFVLDQRRIEFRPLGSAWLTANDGSSRWKGLTMELPKGAIKTALSDANRSITAVSIRSSTARVMYSIFEPIEARESINMTLDETKSILTIHLLRLGLEFRWKPGTRAILSVQHPGYALDENQSIGTLSGLENQLVLLRSCNITEGTADPLGARLVIIPHGRLTFDIGREGRASSTRINDRSTEFHTYRVDTVLGCLRDNGTIQSKLFLCLLHASTSHRLPDKLTRRTGTEEALRILNSAALRSLSAKRQNDQVKGILNQMQHLSPKVDVPYETRGDDKYTWGITWSYFAPMAYCFGFHQSANLRFLLKGSTDRDYILKEDSMARRAVGRAYDYFGAAKHNIPNRNVAKDDIYYAGYPRTQWDNPRFDCELQVRRLANYIAASKRRPANQSGVGRSQTRDWRSGVKLTLGPERDKCLCPTYIQSHPAELPCAYKYLTSRVLPRDCNEAERQLSQCTALEDDRYALILFFARFLFVRCSCRLALSRILRLLAAATTEQAIPAPPSGLRDIFAYNENLSCDERKHVAELERVLGFDVDFSQTAPQHHTFSAGPKQRRPAGTDNIFTRQAPSTHRIVPNMFEGFLVLAPDGFDEQAATRQAVHVLLDRLSGMSRLEHERRYVALLRGSMDALDAQPPMDDAWMLSCAMGEPGMNKELLRYLAECRKAVADIFTQIHSALVSGFSTRPPNVSTVTLLQRLSRVNWPKLSSQWQQCLVDYAFTLAALQRAERLVWAL